jgi:hypothetical protein
VFWSEPGSVGGWSFGDADPHVEGALRVGVGEEVYLASRAVFMEEGDFEFGAGTSCSGRTTAGSARGW